MSKRRLAFLGAVVLTLLGVVTWCFLKGKNDMFALERVTVAREEVAALTAAGAIQSSSVGDLIPGAPPTKAQVEQRAAQWAQLFRTPIAVYGKVIDNHGNPISGATVEIATVNGVQSIDKDLRKTDDNGLFSVVGKKGLGYSLRASKVGYYTTKQSTVQRNVRTPGKGDTSSSTPEKPTVLVLRKQGTTEKLLVAKTGQIDVPKNGDTVHVRFAGERNGSSLLEIASWVGDLDGNRFDWRYAIAVPGGGLKERVGPFDFEAPLDGYLSSAEYSMPRSVESWSMNGKKDYFVKLPDGRFARFSIRFYPGQQRNFVVINSFTNPFPGHRNLEFDTTMADKVEN